MHVFSGAWLTTLLVTAASAVTVCVLARRYPGRCATVINWILAAILIVSSVLWVGTTLDGTRFSVATSLPFALCDLAALIAAAALITRIRTLVELTYFWGLAGTLQSLLTPDLSAPFPSLVFFEYVLAHAAIVCAALVLVVGERITPGPRAVPRVFCISLAYTAFVGFVDWASGGNYMYLREPPGTASLLQVLGPWPWYIASAAGVAIVLFTLLDLPFWKRRTRPSGALEGELRGSGGVRPLAEAGGRVRDHAGSDRELAPTSVRDPAQLGKAEALLAPERGPSSPDDHAGAGVLEEGPRDVTGTP